MNSTAAPIGQTLLKLGLISADQLHIALREQGRSGEVIGRQLVRLGFLSEATLRDALARTLDRRSIDLAHLLPDAAALLFQHGRGIPRLLQNLALGSLLAAANANKKVLDPDCVQQARLW